MELQKFWTVIAEAPSETQEAVWLSMDILDRIHGLSQEKFDGNQALLALKMGASEAEISGWLSGYQNFTIGTLAKLQVAFGESIIAVRADKDE